MILTSLIASALIIIKTFAICPVLYEIGVFKPLQSAVEQKNIEGIASHHD
ncbi:hypothetical protein ACQKDB_11560 [Planococcus kocurii]|nr:hypothetical protein [Planococcus kocurii]